MSDVAPPNPDLRSEAVSDSDSSANTSESHAEDVPADVVSDVLKLFYQLYLTVVPQPQDAADLAEDGGESGEDAMVSLFYLSSHCGTLTMSF